jgi:hypothetical protein
MVERLGARVLFDGHQYLSLWNARLERGRAQVEAWHCERERAAQKAAESDRAETRELSRVLLPLAVQRDGKVRPYGVRRSLRRGDLIHVLISTERHDEAIEWLTGQGWRADQPGEPESG